MKNKKTILLIIILPIIVSAQWVKQESGVTADLLSISFVDSANGLVVGRDNTILSTSDGGICWIKRENPINGNLTKVLAVDSITSFIIGDNGLILKSTNGGVVWNVLDNGFKYDYTDISFVSAKNGWISGVEATSTSRTGVIIHTSNSGKTWEKQIEFSCNCIFGSTIFMAVQFLDDSRGWAFGGDYADNLSTTYIYHSENGGRTWSVIGEWKDWPLTDLKIVTKDILWGSGFPLVTSFDGGKQWQFLGGENSIYARAISPVNGLYGWAISTSVYGIGENGIHYTEDGGETWNEDYRLGESLPTSITNIDGKYIWVAGMDGLIMRKSNITSVGSPNKSVEKFVLEQNYPNPFNPVTTVNYSLPQKEQVVLKVYDILGREVTELVNDVKESGKHSATFNGSNLASGMYIVNLQAGEYYKSLKVLLLK